MDNQQSYEKFLIAEYKHFSDSFWRNEEIGEKRLNFFITLVTAVITALVVLATKKGSTLFEVFEIARYALIALLFLGIVTLLRMLRRNRVTDEYKKAMDSIRCHFRDLDVRFKSYKPFDKGKKRKLGTGGLVEFIAIVNSLIFAAIAYLSFNIGPGYLRALIGFIVSIAIHVLIILKHHKHPEREA